MHKYVICCVHCAHYEIEPMRFGMDYNEVHFSPNKNGYFEAIELQSLGQNS